MAETGTRQHHLALKIGVSDTAVSKWREGANVPDTVSLVKLAEIFHVDAVWLMQLAGIPLKDGVQLSANGLFLADFERLSEADKDEVRALVQFKMKRANGKK